MIGRRQPAYLVILRLQDRFLFLQLRCRWRHSVQHFGLVVLRGKALCGDPLPVIQACDLRPEFAYRLFRRQSGRLCGV